VLELFERREPLIVSSVSHLDLTATIARKASSSHFAPAIRAHMQSLIDVECLHSLFVEILPQHVSRAVVLTRDLAGC
jgi:hypothetical protein